MLHPYFALGWSDRDWSRRLGAATYALIYHLLEVELTAGRSLIVESNFDRRHATGELLALKEKYGFRPVQVLCRAAPEVLLARFHARAESGERHPGARGPSELCRVSGGAAPQRC